MVLVSPNALGVLARLDKRTFSGGRRMSFNHKPRQVAEDKKEGRDKPRPYADRGRTDFGT